MITKSIIPCFFHVSTYFSKKESISLQCQFELKTLAKGPES